MSYEDLYQEILLDHYRNPRHHCTGEMSGELVKHENPLCGDELSLALEVDPATDRISGICFQGHGCSISQASASLMTEAVEGLTRAEAAELVERVRRMLRGEQDGEGLGDIQALEGVARFPVRIKCALLGWMALKEALDNAARNAEAAHGHC
ncbi:SUF system NifU family Fe-S cluster assembly protein [bacterium]|nr:SUF system NifU family Fe-S cluster assembly protein [bacterium]